ncbi:MAG: hypothetical protein R2708_23870 [Vicinamibacterales bacterium]
MSALRLAGTLVLAGAAVACGKDDTQAVTSPTAATATTTTAQFDGVIAPGGRRFYSFTVATSGEVVVTLASVTNAETGAPVDTPLRLGVGRPQGTACPPLAVVTAGAALQSQLTYLAPEGVHCIDVADGGSAATAVHFAVRFTYP